MEDNWLFTLLDFDIGEFVSAFIEAAVDLTFKWTFEVIQDVMTSISVIGASIFDNAGTKAIVGLFGKLGFLLFVIGVVLSIFDISVENGSGKADFKSVFLNWLKSFAAVELFTTLPVLLFSFAIEMQSKVCGDFVDVVLDETTWNVVSVNGTEMTFNPITFYIWVIAVCYAVVKVFMGSLKRGGILLTLVCVGSLYMLNLPRGYTDGFTGWIKQVIGLCFTAFMQTTLLYIGMTMVGSNFFFGLCLMLAASEVPRIADRFGLDTAMRTPSLSSVAMTTNTVMSGIRMIKLR